MSSDPEPFVIRKATHDDFDAIKVLFTTGKVRYFGEFKYDAYSADDFFAKYVTHRILVRISLKDPTVIGYAEITNSPYIPALSEDCWWDWLNYHYCTKLPLSRVNTYFFNTFIYRHDFNPQLVEQVICEIFYRENIVRYVIVAECPDYRFADDKDTPNYYCLEPFATVYYPFCFSVISCPNTQRIHIIYRDDVIPKMRYRRALPEDNDDIVELVDKDRPDMKYIIGEYYIAEELLLEQSSSVLIITEILNSTAGFIWLNERVNITKLIEAYNLEAFGNLISFDPKGTFRERLFTIKTAIRTPINKIFSSKAIEMLLKTIEKQENIDNESDAASLNAAERRSKIFRKLEKIMEKLKDPDHYLQLRNRNYGVLYNVPEDNKNAAFDGRTNVFVIQLFGLMNPHDLRRLFRYLSTAFAAFPDRDYCLLSVSVSQTMTPALFEMLNYFIPVISRPGSATDEFLFITHRSAIYGHLSLYVLRKEDVADIKKIIAEEVEKPQVSAARRFQHTRISTVAGRMSMNIIAGIPSEERLEALKHDQSEFDLRIVSAIMDDIFANPFSKYICYTIKCGDSTKPVDDNITVGFVILRPFNSGWKLKKHFHLPYLNQDPTVNVGEIMILKLNPLFHYQSDMIFRELARLSNYYYYYHFRPTWYTSLSNDLSGSMQPLEPRRIKKIWFPGPLDDAPCSSNLHINLSNIMRPAPQSEVHPIDFFYDHFEAYQNNLCQSVYYGNTMNIVVFGFSNICKAFLRLMLFSLHGMSKTVQASSNCLPHIMITVVCRPGQMEAEYETAFICDFCKDDTECWVNCRNADAFVRDCTSRIDLRKWVRFVTGTVTNIDTTNHIIQLDTGCDVYYETLILMSYTIYGFPPGLLDFRVTPPNYVQINNRFDKLTFYHRLIVFNRELPEDAQKSFVIYGNHIRAFEFINFLVKHGVKGSEISLAMPYQLANLQLGLMLNDSTIDTRIEDILRQMAEDLGVHIYYQMNLYAINVSDEDNLIESVTFKRFLGDEKHTLSCDFFISFWEKYMSDRDLDHSGLELSDGYILVNENFETSDPNIYATGNYIKYRLEPNHQYRFTNPQEAAEKIIQALELNVLEFPQTNWKFAKPYFFQAHLPMDYYFYKVTCPKRYLANHLDNEYGFPLTTYCDFDFTRVRLNEHGMVEEIVLVTKKKKCYDFLKFFCGRHELLLNNLKSRWYLNDIENFLDFFQEPWVELLMNDHFDELLMLNRLLIIPTVQEIVKLDVDRVTRSKIMRNYCMDFGVTNQLEYAFLQFIRDHRPEFSSQIVLPDDFPMKE